MPGEKSHKKHHNRFKIHSEQHVHFTTADVWGEISRIYNRAVASCCKMLTNTSITLQTEVVDSGTTFQSEGCDLFDSREKCCCFLGSPRQPSVAKVGCSADVTQKKKQTWAHAIQSGRLMTPLDGRLPSGHVYAHAHTHTRSAVISALHFLTQCQSASVNLSTVFCSWQEIWVYVATKVIKVKIQFIF